MSHYLNEYKIISVFLVMFLIVPKHFAQDNSLEKERSGSSIMINYGFGNYSVKDEYISKEKYSGSLPYFSLQWIRNHTKYIYVLDMSIRSSSDIKNYNVSTDITQFTLNQGFFYTLKGMYLFDKPLLTWVGPSTHFFIYSNDQNIAISGYEYAQSFAGLFSLGINAEALYPVIPKFYIVSSLNLTALSLGFRAIDNEEDDQSPVKPLTLFSGLNTSFDMGVNYSIMKRLSLTLSYRFELTRVSEWNPLISASDNIILGMAVMF